jgi:hypothetical protein
MDNLEKQIKRDDRNGLWPLLEPYLAGNSRISSSDKVAPQSSFQRD